MPSVLLPSTQCVLLLLSECICNALTYLVDYQNYHLSSDPGIQTSDLEPLDCLFISPGGVPCFCAALLKVTSEREYPTLCLVRPHALSFHFRESSLLPYLVLQPCPTGADCRTPNQTVYSVAALPGYSVVPFVIDFCFWFCCIVSALCCSFQGVTPNGAPRFSFYQCPDGSTCPVGIRCTPLFAGRTG
jgi:hypothetical protein